MARRHSCLAGLLFSSTFLWLTLMGCTGPSFDRQIFAESTARYTTKPLHKALYMNGSDYALYERVGGSDVREMLTLAEKDCKESSVRRHVDPERCAPLYFDDVRLIDPALYQ
jgi:hypothetical protein